MVGTSGKPVTRSSLHPVQDRLREGEGLFQHQRRAELRRHQHLIEAVVERDRQHVQDDVVGRVLEIGGDRGRRGDDVLMRHHHALRESRSSPRCRSASRGRGRCRARGSASLGAAQAPRTTRSRCGTSPSPPVATIVEHEARTGLGSASAATASSFVLREERSRAAIVDDEGELVRLGRGIDRAEHGAGLEHGEDRDHRFPAIVHEDDDAIAALRRRPAADAAASRSDSCVELGKVTAAVRRRPARSCRRTGGRFPSGNLQRALMLIPSTWRDLRRRNYAVTSSLPST